MSLFLTSGLLFAILFALAGPAELPLLELLGVMTADDGDEERGGVEEWFEESPEEVPFTLGSSIKLTSMSILNPSSSGLIFDVVTHLQRRYSR